LHARRLLLLSVSLRSGTARLQLGGERLAGSSQVVRWRGLLRGGTWRYGPLFAGAPGKCEKYRSNSEGNHDDSGFVACHTLLADEIREISVGSLFSTVTECFSPRTHAVFFFRVVAFFGAGRPAFDDAGRVFVISSADSTSRLPVAAA